MSLDKHSFGDGAPHSWGVPALRPLPARRQAHWSLSPSGCLPLTELKRPLAATCVGTTNSYPYRLYPPPGSRYTHAKFPQLQWACPNLAGRTEQGCSRGPTPRGRPEAWRLEHGL